MTDQTVRQAWLDSVVHTLQIAAGRALLIDPYDHRRFDAVFTLDIAAPRTHLERLILRGLLIECAARLGNQLHAEVHTGRRTKCEFVAGQYVDRLMTNHAEPSIAFREWAAAFFNDFWRIHPPTAAHKAAALMRADYRRNWNARELAGSVQTTPARLLRLFRAEYGVSPREYQRALRLIDAVDRVGDETIAAIALHVGYKSKKNFYRAFERVAGITPAALRKLPKGAVEALVETARLTVAGHRRRRVQ